MPSTSVDLQMRPIRGLGHWRAVRQMLRDYAPGVDTLVDQLRAMRFPLGPVARDIAAPIYFSLEQGWALRGPHGEMAAIMYLRCQDRDGVGVVHVDDVNVSAEYRRQGLAQRLFAFADEVARRRQYRFVKLAVTVSNTPAVTLYRRLGYQDQHHLYFSADAQALSTLATPTAGVARLQPLPRSTAAVQSRRMFRAEWEADIPDTAPVMVAYYAWGTPRGALWMEAITHEGQEAGYWIGRQHGQSITVMLGLLPHLWGGEVEQDVLRVLAERAGQFKGSQIRLWAMSGGHHRALRDGVASLAGAFGLTETSDERMIMVKALPPA
jgi:ribosomal protein S18 acetylase RimI-like enzyme